MSPDDPDIAIRLAGDVQRRFDELRDQIAEVDRSFAAQIRSIAGSISANIQATEKRLTSIEVRMEEHEKRDVMTRQSLADRDSEQQAELDALGKDLGAAIAVSDTRITTMETAHQQAEGARKLTRSAGGLVLFVLAVLETWLHMRKGGG